MFSLCFQRYIFGNTCLFEPYKTHFVLLSFPYYYFLSLKKESVFFQLILVTTEVGYARRVSWTSHIFLSLHILQNIAPLSHIAKYCPLYYHRAKNSSFSFPVIKIRAHHKMISTYHWGASTSLLYVPAVTK